LSSRPLRLALAGFAALGAAVLGAYLNERTHPASPPPVPAAAVERAAAAGLAPDGVPSVRPVFALADLTGKSHSIREWDGKALVVNFWATWCAPCRREIPLLNRIHSEYAAKGIEVVGIAVDVVDDVRHFTAEMPIAYPLLVGEQDGIDAARDFGINALAFPFTAFSDAKGRMLSVHLGELHEGTARAILRILERLDAGTLTPEQAREEVRSVEAAAHGDPARAAR
jgi:thiol-disulfide isomerase/thioredoxin